jgi:hypothetical protein
MRLQTFTRIGLLAIILSSLFSCNEKEEFVTDKLTDYFILTPGKYITYRLYAAVGVFFSPTATITDFSNKK